MTSKFQPVLLAIPPQRLLNFNLFFVVYNLLREENLSKYYEVFVQQYPSQTLQISEEEIQNIIYLIVKIRRYSKYATTIVFENNRTAIFSFGFSVSTTFKLQLVFRCLYIFTGEKPEGIL